MVAGFIGMTSRLSLVTLAGIGFASVIGDFFIKYAIAKAGVYIPLRIRPNR